MRTSFWGVVGLCLSCAFLSARAGAEATSAVFVGVDDAPAGAIAAAKSQAYLYRMFKLDVGAMRSRLSNAVTEEAMRAAGGTLALDDASIVEIPMPDGSMQRFAIFEVQTMEPELAARYPFIKTYAGESLEVPGAQVRLSMTARGFHAMILSPEGDVFVNPADAMPTDRTEHYVSFGADVAADGGQFDCQVLDAQGDVPQKGSGDSTVSRGWNLNTPIVAYLPTAEWTALHGGTVAGAISALAELTNRISAIYEREMCVRFILSASQDKLIQMNPATDGLTNTSSSEMLSEASGVFNRLVSPLNCDMRHVLGTVGGGIASLYSACTTQAAVTSSAMPVDNWYSVMVVCHEMGHQFGAPHTFSGTGERCAGNAGDCVEPGGGSTIMSYAQQCYPDNIVSRSDMQFHANSLPTMSWMTNCGAMYSLWNVPPEIVLPAGVVYRAPANTPLWFSCEIADSNQGAMTISWDNIDGGTSPVPLSYGDRGTNSLFRTFPPSTARERVFPGWPTLLRGEPSVGERLPTRSRALNMRIYARDNYPGGGASSYQDFQVIISASTTGFRLLTPQDGLAHSAGPLNVTWTVAGTFIGPFNLKNVSISLMRNDDDRDPIVLTASTPNDGAEIVQLPDGLALARARILVRPVNGVFFDVSRKPFALYPASEEEKIKVAGPVRISDSFANGNGNGVAEAGESRVRVSLPLLNAAFTSAENVRGTLISHTPTVRVIVPEAAWATIAPASSQENATPFVISIAPDHPCGEPAELEFVVRAGESGVAISHANVEIGNSTKLSPTQITSYTGPAMTIPDGDEAGVSVALSVPELPGVVNDVKFRFDGTPSVDMNSTAVGLNHPFVGDLVMTLTNPAGTTIELVNRPGTIGNFGHNFAGTLFDMKQIVSEMQNNIPRRAPYDGVFFPKDDLNLLAGGDGAGVWTLKVKDMRPGQSPEASPTVAQAVRKFSVYLTRVLPPICEAPKAYCEGDLNLDGVVDDADFSLFVVGYDAYFSGAGDLDGDTLTTDVDFSLFVVAYDAFACP